MDTQGRLRSARPAPKHCSFAGDAQGFLSLKSSAYIQFLLSARDQKSEPAQNLAGTTLSLSFVSLFAVFLGLILMHLAPHFLMGTFL